MVANHSVICPMHFISILKVRELSLGEFAPRFKPGQRDSKAQRGIPNPIPPPSAALKAR